MTVTSAPIGSTGQSLDGFAVSANVPDAFRESVVLTDPVDPLAAVQITSTQPIGFYGVPVWMQGTPNVAIAGALPNVSSFPLGTTQVFGTVSSQIVSSVPILVAQSTSPWTVNGGVAVTNTPTVTVQGTSFVNVASSVPHALVGTSQVFGTVSTQIVSSIPIFVSQSSAPWSIIGGVNVSSQSAVSSSWPLSTTLVNIVSSIPLGGGTQYAENAATTVATGNVSMWMAGAAESTVVAVATSQPLPVYQVSSVPITGTFVEIGTTSTNLNVTSIVLIASLNTTVIKAGPGVLYSYQISNFASTSLFVKFANASSAVIASTAKFMKRVGVAPSTSIFGGLDVGHNFSTGITIFTTRNAFDSDLTAPLGSTAVVNISWV